MASFLTRLMGAAPARAPVVKASRGAAVFPIGLPGFTRPQPRRLSELVRQGYEQNPIVFRSVRMVAESVASVPWLAPYWVALPLALLLSSAVGALAEVAIIRRLRS